MYESISTIFLERDGAEMTTDLAHAYNDLRPDQLTLRKTSKWTRFGADVILAWLGCRPPGLDNPAAFFLKHAKVGLSDGATFGAPGVGHVRLNLATSRGVLTESRSVWQPRGL